MGAISKLGRVFDFAIDKMARLADVILMFLMLSVCADVILRYFFNRPQAWVAEISEYLLLYITFLGAAWVLKNEGHVIVDVLVAQVSPKARAVLGVISSVIGAFVLSCRSLVWDPGDLGSVQAWGSQSLCPGVPKSASCCHHSFWFPFLYDPVPPKNLRFPEISERVTMTT